MDFNYNPITGLQWTGGVKQPLIELNIEEIPNQFFNVFEWLRLIRQQGIMWVAAEN